MGLLRAFLATLVAALLLPAFARAAKEKTLPELQARFDRETNGEHKAKMLKDLCEAQIQAERTASNSGDFNTAGLIMEKYRDNIKSAFNVLRKMHPNAVKRPNGYKRIEFQNQNGLREVEDLLVVIPAPYKPPMEIVRADMSAMENQLLLLLFPDRPLSKPLPQKAKEPPLHPNGSKP
jgi:hypothetical protein